MTSRKMYHFISESTILSTVSLVWKPKNYQRKISEQLGVMLVLNYLVPNTSLIILILYFQELVLRWCYLLDGIYSSHIQYNDAVANAGPTVRGCPPRTGGTNLQRAYVSKICLSKWNNWHPYGGVQWLRRLGSANVILHIECTTASRSWKDLINTINLNAFFSSLVYWWFTTYI